MGKAQIQSVLWKRSQHGMEPFSLPLNILCRGNLVDFK